MSISLKEPTPVGGRVFSFSFFLLPPVASLEYKHKMAPVAIFKHKFTFKMKPHAKDGESSDGSLMSAWRRLTNSTLPVSGLVSHEREIHLFSLFKPFSSVQVLSRV